MKTLIKATRIVPCHKCLGLGAEKITFEEPEGFVKCPVCNGEQYEFLDEELSISELKKLLKDDV